MKKIFFGIDYCPDFLDFGLFSNFNYFPHYYLDILEKGNSIFTGDLNNNNNKYKIKETEVFK